MTRTAADLQEALQGVEVRVGSSCGDLGADFAVGLRTFCASVSEASAFNSLGYRLLVDDLERIVRTRQWLVEVASESEHNRGSLTTRGPVVITGLPRSGTTALHRLMALWSAASAISLRSAEWPGVPSSEGASRSARRLRALESLAPDFLRMHPMSPSDPEEDVTLQQLTGWSTQFALFVPAPRYLMAMAHRDLRIPYEEFRRYADLIHADARTLVLKGPSHLGWLSELLIDPTVRVVVVHREPYSAMRSWQALTAAACAPFVARNQRIAESTGHWLDFWTTVARRAVPFAEHPRVLTVSHRDILIRPLPVLRLISEWGDIPLDTQDLRRSEQWLCRHPATQFGHAPDLVARSRVERSDAYSGLNDFDSAFGDACTRI